LNKNEEIKPSINEKLQEIMQLTNTTIIIDYNKNDKVKPPPGLGSDSIKVDILGQWENVEKARLKCLVYFDELVRKTNKQKKKINNKLYLNLKTLLI